MQQVCNFVLHCNVCGVQCEACVSQMQDSPYFRVFLCILRLDAWNAQPSMPLPCWCRLFADNTLSHLMPVLLACTLCI